MARTGNRRASEHPRPARPRTIGDYELLDELGRGGMGIVYRARQVSLDRHVALKTLPSFAGLEAAAVVRFRREAAAAARLSHPGIVPVYDVGESDGTHYYAMELVEGPSLAELLERLGGRVAGRLLGSLAEETGLDRRYSGLEDPPGSSQGARYARSCAALIAEVANALAAAHAGNIVHRDLKPSNVMIHGAGRPVLLDFGLARDELAVGLTRTGDTVGTPSYMAPEQARGRRDVDSRADVWGLGATLYELLTLRPPFEGGHAGEIMRRILDEDPVPVRKLNARVPVDLQTIVHNCLAKDPDGRYPAIEALELDLRNFLAGRPIEAREPSSRERALRFLRRNRKPAVVGAAATMAAAAVVLTAGLIADYRDRVEGHRALEEARTALLVGRDVDSAVARLREAAILLDDDEVMRRARVDLAIAAGDALYGSDRSALAGFLEEGIEESDRDELRGLLDKVEGRGRLLVRVSPPEAESAAISLRRVITNEHGDDALGPKWEPLPASRQLRIGHYLMRVEHPGYRTLIRKVAISRDRESAVAVPLRTADQVPERLVEVVDPDTGAAVGVSRTEMMRIEYRRFLESLSDPELRREMTPPGWTPDGALERPVQGLSYRQARAAAAHLGMHVLSEREFVLAATAGLDFDYPWGDVSDPSRIAADPDELNAPHVALSMHEGASPLGVVHLLGNVAEILAPEPGEAVVVAGGHFQSTPSELSLRRGQLLQSLATFDTPGTHAGVRLATFLPRPDDLETEARAHEAGERMRADHASLGALFHEWTVRDTGVVGYRLTIHGVSQSEDRVLRLPFVTTGFLQVGEPVARIHRDALRVEREMADHRELSRLAVELPNATRENAGYRLQLDADLVPVDGLTGESDSYLLRLPIKAGPVPVRHVVLLPAGSRVESAEPAPRFVYEVGGRTRLVWDVRYEHGVRMKPAVVRFRMDGSLAATWPTRRRVDDFSRAFFAALRGGQAEELADLVDAAYLQLPSGLDRARLTSGERPEEPRLLLESPRLIDFTVVGPVVTLDLETHWHPPGGVEIADWPLRLQALRDGDALRAVRLMPKGRSDEGSFESGAYRHPGLKIGIAPVSGHVQRTRDQLTDVQVRIAAPTDEEVSFHVLGQRARPGQTTEEMRVWLTAGAIVLRRGESVGGMDVPALVGPAGRRIAGQSSEWLFGEGRSRCARERWIFVRKGLRHFLVRAVAMGDSRADANRRFDDHRSWFATMADAVVIQ